MITTTKQDKGQKIQGQKKQRTDKKTMPHPTRGKTTLSPARPATLSDLISRFLDYRRYLSSKTIDYYQKCLSGFRWYAQCQDFPPPAEITRQHIIDFLTYVATEKHRWPGQRRESFKQASPATVHHYGRVVHTFFNWTAEEGLLPHNPTLYLKLPRPHYKQVQPYSDDDVRAMLATCEQQISQRYLGIRNKAIISIFADTGLRLSELSGIKLSNLDSHLRQVRVLGKGDKLRVVPIDGAARKALQAYLRIRNSSEDYLWLTEFGTHLSAHAVQTLIGRIKIEAGISETGGPHRFRHYFATRYLDAGGDINSLRLLLGHSSLSMVLQYSRYASAQRAIEEHQQFSPLRRLYEGNNHNGDRQQSWGYVDVDKK